MDDNNIQQPTKAMPSLQPSNWRIQLGPSARQKVIGKIMETMRKHCTRADQLSQVERIAKSFEEKVFAVALDKKDYLKRISAKMSSLDGGARSGQTNPSMQYPASSVPNPLHSASGSVRSQEFNHIQLPLQSINPSRPQTQQIISSNTPSSRGFHSVSSSVSPVSGTSQTSGSNFTSQSSNARNLSTMPSDLGRNAAKQCMPSNPVALSCGLEQQRQHLQQKVCNSYGQQFLDEQKAQNRLPMHNSSHGIIVSRPEKTPIQQPQRHQDQTRCAQSPYSLPRPAMESSMNSAHMPDVGSSIRHTEQSTSHHPQPVAIRHHGSSQDIPNQRKLMAVQQKAIHQHSSSSTNGQNQLVIERLPDTLQNQQQQPKNVQSVQQYQQVSGKKKHYTRAHPHKPGEQSIAYHGQQNRQQHTLPLGPEAGGLGVQKASCGFSSSQWGESQEKVISQPQRQVFMEQKKSNSCVSSESQNLRRPVKVTIESGTVPLKASKDAAGEKHVIVEAWREKTFHRITAMKSRYMSKLQELHYIIVAKLKQLHPEQNQSQLEKLKDIRHMAERMLRLLNIPKEKLVPEHGESLDTWEKQIICYLSKFFKPKNTSTLVQQGQNPRHESLQESTSHQVVSSSGLKEKHLTNQHIAVKTKSQDLPQMDPLETRKTTSSNPPFSTPTHQSEKAQQPARHQLVTSLESPTSPLPSEHRSNNNDLVDDSESLSEKTSIGLTPIQRLVNSVISISPCALKSSIDDFSAVMSMVDGMEATSLEAGWESSLGQDLALITANRLQATYLSLHAGISGVEETNLCKRPFPIEIWNDPETTNQEPTTQNHKKKPRIDASDELQEEISDVNQRLIDSQVNICEKDINIASVSELRNGEGTLVKCCFNGVSVNPGFIKTLGWTRHLSTIEPLHLLVPSDYPKCSPVLLDNMPGEISDELLDLSTQARSKLEANLRGFKEPVTLSEIARTWEVCARAVFTEHAEKWGGGNFSSICGTWENWLSTA